jgi:hypothetical protein
VRFQERKREIDAKRSGKGGAGGGRLDGAVAGFIAGMAGAFAARCSVVFDWPVRFLAGVLRWLDWMLAAAASIC